MCNIHLLYKLTGNIDKTDINVILKLLNRANSINDDGFGLFDNNQKIYKSAEKYDKKFKETIIKFFSGNGTRFMIAHNRLATSGKVKSVNSHPFYNDSFIWVHNGIVKNLEELKTKYGIDKINVDSEIIGYIMHEKLKSDKSIINAIKETCKELSGMFSVVLFDKINNKLYYFKNSSANFSIQLIKKDNDYYIVGTTEENNLYWLFSKNLFGFTIDDYKVISDYAISNDMIYEINDYGINEIESIEFKSSNSIAYDSNGYVTVDKDYTRIELEENLNELLDTTCITVLVTKKGNYKFTCDDESVKKKLLDLYGYYFKDKNNLVMTKREASNMLDMIYDYVGFYNRYSNTDFDSWKRK